MESDVLSDTWPQVPVFSSDEFRESSCRTSYFGRNDKIIFMTPSGNLDMNEGRDEEWSFINIFGHVTGNHHKRSALHIEILTEVFYFKGQ